MTDDRTRRVDPADYERFVAFTFAAADLVVEADAARRIVYAAGAFEAEFGRGANAFVGQPLSALLAPADHDVLEMAWAALGVSGRASPSVVRMAGPAGRQASLAALALPRPETGTRHCFSLSSLPTRSDEADTSPGALLRRAEQALRERTGRLELIEVLDEGARPIAACLVEEAVRASSPAAMSAALAPGRYGLMRNAAEADGAGVEDLRAHLAASGVRATVLSRTLPLGDVDLTPMLAVRALRHAVSAFARDGAPGLAAAGCEGGLAGYLHRAQALAGSLRRIIRDESFGLTYQPIVAMRGRAVQRYEALIRPSRAIAGIGSPQEFVMMVEALGMADQLDAAVVRIVCEVAATSGHAIAVNLSNQSVQSERFRTDIVARLRGEAAARRRISMELTETAEIEDLDAVVRTAEQLRSIGVTLALDDFGTGSSGIDVLRAVRPEVVKIDGSFTAGIARSTRARAMLQGMIQIARASADRVVAERVETEDEARILSSWDVDEGQGWLFGRPRPLPAPARAGEARRRVGVQESWGR